MMRAKRSKPSASPPQQQQQQPQQPASSNNSSPVLPSNPDDRISCMRRAAPIIFDCLIHHNLQWGSMTFCWGAINSGRVVVNESASGFLPAYNVEQTFYYSQRTDGTLNPSTRQWTGEPAELLCAHVALPKPRTTPKSVIGRYQERSRSQRIGIVKRIVHPGEVNRVRSMPQQPNLLVTTTDSPTVFFWDADTQPHRAPNAASDASKSSTPDLELSGHEADISINALDTALGHLVLSGGADQLVILHNLKQERPTEPQLVFKGHTDAVEDCCFRPDQPEQACSVGRDRALRIWDARTGGQVSGKDGAHAEDVNAVGWSPLNSSLIATGGSDRRAHIFDTRRLDKPVGVVALDSAVINVAWSPHHAQTLALSDEEATVRLFRVGDDGVRPMLLHCAHRSPVVDVQWNTQFPWLLASVSDDSDTKGGGGTLQIWRVSEFVERELDAEWAASLAMHLGARSRSNSVNSTGSQEGEEQ